MRVSINLILEISLFYIAWASPVNKVLTVISNKKLFIRSLPGYSGGRSNLYEVHMEPYLSTIGLKAMVEIRSLSEDGNSIGGPRGILTLEQLYNGVRIYGTITGLNKGLHGFHVHEKGDLSKGCGSAGPHFNPYLFNHGAPNDQLRHVGDLGNVDADEDGIAQIDGVDHYLSLLGVRGAIGRAIVVHEKQDDLGRGGTEESAKTGSAGSRLACGVVGFI
ncbi:PREDICTED: superoxide dismutase [Cu-Zn]-like [Ceratosolen solmsi marchali]|uniref:superoxide dismutase n=1 Tax=Ceratosolen solmsi marchali TaxID=326594 RepID=A0AAJ6YS46_9HYME|nr:PREDICTED: superoxide dismutase [Cu-Zn]-like [Ceratosolen solmsi marchali]XP_011503273.1 PREDICTED: superoxide dismutase [Cu-Zn]-like [Ceratosolen solmsi marchali]